MTEMTDVLIKILNYVISFLDRFERNDEKIIRSFGLNGINLETDTGFKPANFIHLTKPFQVYHIDLENGYNLDCADNHLVFNDNFEERFVRDVDKDDMILTNEGTVKITNKYVNKYNQCMCDVSIGDENHRYYTNGILSHNTTMSAVFLLHYVLFNVDKNALVVGNKRKTAIEILDKIKKIYLELPYYLKPGIYKWNESEIVFDNGCRIMAEATTINSGISFTFHCILADEFAHIAPNIKEKFYNNLFPTITASKARFMITSTQNGFDLFCRIYKAAEQGLNEYAPFKTDWDEVPEWNPDKKCWEKRDEVWHQRQVANYGSEEAFNAQFGTNFDVNANTLINTKILRKKQHEALEYINKDIPGVSNSQYFFWRPDYEPSEDLRNDFITVTIDIAEGGGGDYTVFNFNKMTQNGDECVGFFRCNVLGIDKVVLSLMEIAIMYLHPLHHCISLEYNTYGELFVSKIIEARDKNPHVSSFDESNFVKYYNEAMTSFRIGIKLTSATKTVGCKLFKEQYEKGIIINPSTVFLMELENFCDNKGNDTYQASFGHDDVVMSQIQLVHAKQSNAYKYLRSEFDSLTTSDQSNSSSNNNQFNLENRFFNPETYVNPYSNMDDIYNAINQNSSVNRLQRFG